MDFGIKSLVKERSNMGQRLLFSSLVGEETIKSLHGVI